MASWFEIKVRAVLGMDPEDDKEVVILGRVVRWMERGIEYEADPKHRRFGLHEDSRKVASNGEKETRFEEGDDDGLDKAETTEFRGVAARLSFLSLDCPDLQFPSKACSRESLVPKGGPGKV